MLKYQIDGSPFTCQVDNGSTFTGSPSVRESYLKDLLKNIQFVEIFFESKHGKYLSDKTLSGLLGKICGKYSKSSRRKKTFTKKDILNILYENNLVDGETNEEEINKFLFTTKFAGKETYVFRRFGEQDYILQVYKPYIRPINGFGDISAGDIFG